MDLLRAAERLRDLLILDGDPPTLAIPPDVDSNEFTQAFECFCAAINANRPVGQPDKE